MKGDVITAGSLIPICLVCLVCLFCGVASAPAGEFHRAVESGDRARVEQMLRSDPKLVNQPDEDDRWHSLPLHFAAMGGHVEIARLLLEAGAELEGGDSDESRPLDVAAQRGQVEMVKFLLDRGADIDEKDNNGSNPLSFALSAGRVEVMRLLLDRGADATVLGEGGLGDLLVRTGFSGSAEMAEFLLGKGVEVDAANTVGRTALQGASEGGHLELMRLLIAKGADVNRADQWGLTPLMRAADRGQTEAVRLLLSAQAAAGLQDRIFGRTALHLAVRVGQIEPVRALLDGGAPIDARDRAGRLPADLAVSHGHREIARLLAQRGMQPGETSRDQGLAGVGPVPKGEAHCWSLGHSGWAIKTQHHLLVFDYFEADPRPEEPHLSNGHIVPAEIAGEKVIVFASHEHGDHYDPLIFGWRDQVPDITYVLGCQPSDASDYVHVAGRQMRSVGDAKIRTIESNDSGVGLVVDVDGVTIFHAGDHANRLRDMSGPYKAEIDYLVAQGVRPDIAMMPISGCGFGDQEAVRIGVYYALEKLTPHLFVPLHAGRSEFRYHEFIAECEDRFPQTTMHAPETAGDCFRYRDGGLAALNAGAPAKVALAGQQCSSTADKAKQTAGGCAGR